MSKRARVALTLVVFAFALLGASASPARADDASEKARLLFQQGSKHYDVGQFDKAVEAWQAGYELKPDPSFLFNIAQAYRQKDDPQRAIFFYKSYLRNAPKAPNRADVEQRIAALQKQLNEPGNRPAAAPPAPPPMTAPPPAAPPVWSAPPPPATAPPPPATTPPPPPAAAVDVTTTGGAGALPPPAGPGAEPATTAVVVGQPPTDPNARRFDMQAALGSAFWSSGVQGQADPSFAFTLATGYTFGDPGSRFRFRLGALFGYTFLSEPESRETFLSFLIDPTLDIRLSSTGRWHLYVDLGLGVLSVLGLESTSALLDQTRSLKVQGAQALGLTRLGVGLEYRVTPALGLFVWPAAANSPQKDHFYEPIARVELLFGAAFRL